MKQSWFYSHWRTLRVSFFWTGFIHRKKNAFSLLNLGEMEKWLLEMCTKICFKSCKNKVSIRQHIAYEIIVK